MISTACITLSTTGTDRGIAMGSSAQPVARSVAVSNQKKSADYCITAELRASSFNEGHVWLRPLALDVLVPTTPGHLAWSPPT